MNTTQGGSMASMILFGVAMVAFIAAVVVYLMKDDTTSKKWVDQTKVVIAANESLAGQMKDAIEAFESVCKNHATLTDELSKQKEQLAKLEFAAMKPATGVQLPSTINFTVVERRRVVSEQPKPADKLNGAHPLPAPQAAPATQKVIKKIKKQMKDLSQ